MKQQGSLQGKVALVTGAAMGIGRCIALRLAATGAKVGLNDKVSMKEAEDVIEEVRQASAEVRFLEADVSNAAQVQGMFQEVEDMWGGVDILVNNAGLTRDSLL